MAEQRTVTVTCRRCGPVAVLPDALRVTDESRGDGLFEFTCPRCARDVWQAASAGTLAVLRSVGAAVLLEAAPLELAEPHAGPPVTWDDVLDAHEQMAGHCCPQDELTV